jgi:hypothetical protein
VSCVGALPVTLTRVTTPDPPTATSTFARMVSVEPV